MSDLIKHLRESGKIDTEFIKDKLFPKYKEGEISTNEDFYEYLVELGVQERAGDLEAYIKDLEQKSMKTNKSWRNLNEKRRVT